MSGFNTYIAYRDNNSFTSEVGASKFMKSMLTTHSNGVGDSGGIINGFNVTATPTPSMAVKIVSGEVGADSHCVIDFNNYCYFGWMTNDYTLTIAGASQSASRISYVVAYIDRTITYEESENVIESPNVLKIVEVPGTESSTPVPPTSSQIQGVIGVNNPYIILAKISVAQSASTITDALITDMRQFSQIDKSKLSLDIENSYAAGFKQPNQAGTDTRIIVTEPNEAEPAAIEGVQLIWLKKKA